MTAWRSCNILYLSFGKRDPTFEQLGPDADMGSAYVSGKLTTYPSPNLTLTLTSHFGQNVGLGEG